MSRTFYDWLPAKPAMSPHRPLTSELIAPTRLQRASPLRAFSQQTKRPERSSRVFLAPPRFSEAIKPETLENAANIDDLCQLLHVEPRSAAEELQLQLLQCEQTFLLLEYIQEEIPYMSSLLTSLREGIERCKPHAELHNEELREMLETVHGLDNTVGLDLNGLARVLVKKRREVAALNIRLTELKDQQNEVLKQRRLALESEDVLDAEIERLERLVEAKEQTSL